MARRRFEVFTGAGRRREWSAMDKARIVAESHEPGAEVSEVARRYALTPQQLFIWRRWARRAIAGEAVPPPVFVPAVVMTGANLREFDRVLRDVRAIDGVLDSESSILLSSI